MEKEIKNLKRYALDTHALFWYLTASPNLSEKAKTAIEKGIESGDIVVSVITLAELYYLNEKLGNPLNFLVEFKRLKEIFEVASVEAEDILSFPELSEIEEMHDRLITSIALRYKAVLITKDKDIRLSKMVRVLW